MWYSVGMTQKTKDYSKAVGMPDDWDIKNIQSLISKYERAFPGEIDAAIAEAKESQEYAYNDFSATPNKNSTMRHCLVLPAGLHMLIKEAYPTMFKDKKHRHWFMKKFRKFTVPKKI